MVLCLLGFKLTQVKAAQIKLDEALEVIQRLEDESTKDGKQIEEQKARVAELEQLVSQLSNDNAAAHATAEQLRHQVKSQQAELERVHKDHEQERTQHRERIEKLSADHASAQDKAAMHAEQLQTAVADAQKKLEQSERDRLETAIKLEQSEQKTQAAEQIRELANKKRDAAVKEAAELRGHTDALKTQNAQLLATLAETSQAPDKRQGKTD